MRWTRIIAAANGRPQSLAWFVRRGPAADVAALTTLLLLEEAPHPAAALVAAAKSPDEIAPLVRAALEPQIDAALAAWRADPQVLGGAFDGAGARGRLTWGVAGMVGALRDRLAAQHDAVAIVLRDGDSVDVARCLAALGSAGWRALEDEQRDALLARDDPDDLGRVWGALDDAQRAATTQRAARHPKAAAQLIASIAADDWQATDPMLRERLITTVLRNPVGIRATAPAWAGMTDAERETLARAVIDHGDAAAAINLLDALGAAGRATLTVEQRAAIETLAMSDYAWIVWLLRAADGGWGALKDDERGGGRASMERPRPAARRRRGGVERHVRRRTGAPRRRRAPQSGGILPLPAGAVGRPRRRRPAADEGNPG